MGVLCLGAHGTWSVGGANVGEGAAVSGGKEPVWFLGRRASKEVALRGPRGEVSGGRFSGHEGGVCLVPDVRLALQEDLWVWRRDRRCRW